MNASRLGLSLLFVTVGCANSMPAARAPDAGVEHLGSRAALEQPMLDEAVQPAADATPTFSFKVANQCDDLWRAMVVPSEQNRGFTENASIEVKRNEEHAMSMRVGDVVVLTNSSGGITAKDFESWERGEGAKLVVIDDCTGVRTTYGRGIR